MTDLLYWLLVQQSAWWSGAISVVMMWKMGSRVWWAPFLGLVGQVFWLLLAWFTNQPGMVVAALVYTFVHGRNARKWWVERRNMRRRVKQYVGRPASVPLVEQLPSAPGAGQIMVWSSDEQRWKWTSPHEDFAEQGSTRGTTEDQAALRTRSAARDPFTGQTLRWIDSPHGQGHWSYPPHG